MSTRNWPPVGPTEMPCRSRSPKEFSGSTRRSSTERIFRSPALSITSGWSAAAYRRASTRWVWSLAALGSAGRGPQCRGTGGQTRQQYRPAQGSRKAPKLGKIVGVYHSLLLRTALGVAVAVFDFRYCASIGTLTSPCSEPQKAALRLLPCYPATIIAAPTLRRAGRLHAANGAETSSLALRLTSSPRQGIVSGITPAHACRATCRTDNPQGELLSVPKISQACLSTSDLAGLRCLALPCLYSRSGSGKITVPDPICSLLRVRR